MKWFKRRTNLEKEKYWAKGANEYASRLSQMERELREGNLPSILTIANILQTGGDYIIHLANQLNTLERKLSDIEKLLERQTQKASQ